MTAQIYQIRDYQSPKDLERMRQQMAAEIKVDVPEMVHYHGQDIDGIPYYSPEKDPA